MSIAIRLISVFVTLAVCSPATGASARRWLRRSRRAGARGGPQGTLGAAPAGAGRRAGHARPLRPREALERAADEAHVGDAGRRARVEAAHRVHVARSPAHHEEEEGVATNTLYPYQTPGSAFTIRAHHPRAQTVCTASPTRSPGTYAQHTLRPRYVRAPNAAVRPLGSPWQPYTRSASDAAEPCTGSLFDLMALEVPRVPALRVEVHWARVRRVEAVLAIYLRALLRCLHTFPHPAS